MKHSKNHISNYIICDFTNPTVPNDVNRIFHISTVSTYLKLCSNYKYIKLLTLWLTQSKLLTHLITNKCMPLWMYIYRLLKIM